MNDRKTTDVLITDPNHAKISGRIGVFLSLCCSISLFLNACTVKSEQLNPLVATVNPTNTPVLVPTQTAALIQSSPIEITEQIATNQYLDCGPGELLDKDHFFRDQNGVVSPTQLIRTQFTSDEVRRYLSVISCLAHDQGWQSDSDEVEGGYENEIIFFDKFGIGHKYRIIIGGHYISPYNPVRKDIEGSVDGQFGNYQFFLVDDWIEISSQFFEDYNIRQIGFDLYIEDTDGNLSKVLKKVYQFKETNILIEQALKSGEGYPEQVPEGYFLFATRAWLLPSE